MDALQPRLNLLNKPLLGELVKLIPFSSDDITSEYVGWLNDSEVVEYSNQRFQYHSAKSCQKYLDSFKNTSNLFFKIIRYADEAMVGTITAYVSIQHRTADMGIMIGDRSAWGKGIGQDAWTILLKRLLSHDGVRKVTGGTMRCNQGMVKIIERSGMMLEAVRPKQELLNGIPVDLVYYGKFSVQ